MHVRRFLDWIPQLREKQEDEGKKGAWGGFCEWGVVIFVEEGG